MHQALDARSLAMHRLVAKTIRHDPAPLDRARAMLDRWRQTDSFNTLPHLDEWARILDQGFEACLAVATEESARS